VLRDVLGELTSRGFAVSHLSVDRSLESPGRVGVSMHVTGKGPPAALAAAIAALDGVLSVVAGDVDAP
jgi:acetolactate synthase regulatory subunit